MNGGRVALVTGAASGIGRATARRLAAAGLALALADVDGDALAATAEEIPGALSSVCDVTQEAAVAAAFDAAEATLGPVAVLVTSAGIMLGGREAVPLAALAADDWEATFAVNARGTFLCVREMLRRRGEAAVADGRIVTLSSAAAQLGGYRADAAYVASKAAVLGLTKIAARQAAALGITVNAVAAGPVETPMFDRAMAPGAVPALAGRIPLGRIGSPEDVAAMVTFLASPEAGWITGATFDVNGGYRMA